MSKPADRKTFKCTLTLSIYIRGFHRNSGLRFTYGNDREIFSISIMENFGTIVPELRNFPEYCSEKFRFTKKSFRNFPGKGSGKTFLVYKMETVNILVFIWSEIIPEFRFTQQISGSFHFQNGNCDPKKWKPYWILNRKINSRIKKSKLKLGRSPITKKGRPLQSEQKGKVATNKFSCASKI